MLRGWGIISLRNKYEIFLSKKVVFYVIGRVGNKFDLNVLCILGQKPKITCEAGGWVGFCPKCTYYIEILFILGSKGGKEGGGGDSISGFIGRQQKCFVLEMIFILSGTDNFC